MRIRTFYDLLAPVYGRVMPSFLERVTIRVVQRLSAGGPASILDVGVGSGHILAAFAEKTSARIVGVDLSMSMIRQARRSARNGQTQALLVQADTVHLPFPEGSFEGVVASFVVDLLPADQIPAALRELSRVLAPGGRIVVASMHVSNALVKQAWLLAYRALPEVVGHLRPVEFTDQLHGLGLRLLREEEIPVGVGSRLLTLVKVVG
jgi:demethylmenaquinone methyltransferase/2-methoxy-6-polyprenyl-1,4-benzoquinol methylase